MATPPETPPNAPTPLLEKGIDFTLGVGVVTVEAIQHALTHLPVVWETVREKGRPARESLLRNLRNEFLDPLEGLGVPTTSEIKQLEARVAVLEQQVGAAPLGPDDPIADEPAPPPSETPEPRGNDPQDELPVEKTPGHITERSDALTTGADTATDIAPEPGQKEDEAA